MTSPMTRHENVEHGVVLKWMRGGNLKVLFSLLLNIVSSVGVIIVNKRLVYNEAGFHFVTLLTVMHFIASFFGCLMLSLFGFFEIKRLHIAQVLTISAAFCGYVVFNNFSLLANTVSVYQTSKILCTPLIVLIEYAAYNKQETKETLLAIFITCLGSGITVCADTRLTVEGTIWALLAILANSLYTIWGNTKQKDLGVNAAQLLIYQAPVSSLMLLFAVPIDGLTELRSYEVTPTSVWTIALSCILAFGVNLSFFLLVGQTSPLTTNIVGYLKTVLVFIGGFVFISSEADTKTLLGVTVTLVGLGCYTATKVRALSSPSSAKESRLT